MTEWGHTFLPEKRNFKEQGWFHGLQARLVMHRLRNFTILWLLVSHGSLLAYFPIDDENWETLTTIESGAAPALLQSAIEYAGANNTKALIVLHQGKIVVEQYWDGWDRTTRGPSYSAAKSLVSILVGQAIEAGVIDSLDQPASEFLDEWADDPAYQDITIRHLLTMTTGFSESPLTLLLLQQATSERRFGTRREPEFPPGTRWYYNDAAYRLLFYLLEEAYGKSLPTLSQESLFDPIGMNHTAWHIREETSLGESYQNYQWLDFTALDAARFGLLALNQGNWDGTQIVPATWIRDSTMPDYDFAPFYGRLWWLNSSSSHRTPSSELDRDGPFAPDAPPDMFAALGAFDQKIYVIPSLDLVVVRLGTEALGNSLAVGVFDNLLLGKISQSFGYEGPNQKLDLEIDLAHRELQLSFPTWNGRSYTLSRSTNLKTWEEVDGYTGLLGDGSPIQFSEEMSENEFFRVRTSF